MGCLKNILCKYLEDRCSFGIETQAGAETVEKKLQNLDAVDLAELQTRRPQKGFSI